MRLSYLSDSVIPSETANSVHVVRMCAALAAIGTEVTLFARPGRGDDRSYGDFYGLIPSFPIVHSFFAAGWRGRNWLYGGLSAWRAWRTKPAAAYCRCVHSARNIAALGVPVFFELHAMPSANSQLHRRILPSLFRHPRFAGLITITQALARDAQAAYGLADAQVLVAPDGADAASAVEPRKLAQPGRLAAGYVGHLYPGKGMELIVPLARRCGWADFHVVGGTAEWLAHWRREAADCPNLIFHGFVPPAETGRYMAAFDVALLPNQPRVNSSSGSDIGAWTSPLKLFEYMSHGRAILASDLPVLREILTPGENCLMCPPADPAAWADALQQLQDQPELRRTLGARARQQLEAQFTWRRRAENLMAYVERQLAGKKPDAR